MKMMILYVFVLALFTACQNDAFDFLEKSREIKFSLTTPGEVMTKATRTNFDVGDKIGIYVVRHLPYNSPVLLASGNFADNKCFKVANGNILQPASESDKIFVESDGYAYSIYAYYPYDEMITDPTNIDFEINSYQVQIQGVKEGDFMLCQVLNSDITNPISLNFKRKLSLINVIYNKEPDGIKPVIAIYGFYSNCKINLQTGILTEGHNEYSSIAPMLRYYEDINQCHYCAIVAPYNFKNSVTFQVNKNGNLSYYSIPNRFPLEEGTENIFYLSESPKNVSCSAVSDIGIGGTVSGNGTYMKGQLCTVTATVNDEYIFDGWYIGNELVSKNLSYSFPVSSDIHLEAHFSKCSVITIHDNQYGRYKDYLKGAGKYRKNEVCYLKADVRGDMDNMNFIGWFVDGKLMSRHWWYAFQPNKSLDIEARYGIIRYSSSWYKEEVTFPATPGTYYWEYTCPTVTYYYQDQEMLVATVEAFFVEDSSYYEYPHTSMYGFFEDINIQVCNLDLSKVLFSTTGSTGLLYYQNTSEPGVHVRRKVKYKYISQRNRPVKGIMYVRMLTYKASQLDFEQYIP